MPGFTDDSGVRAASGPDLREVTRSSKALEKTTAAISVRRRKATGMPLAPLDEAAARTGRDVAICRAFMTFSGYVPGHSIRAAPVALEALTGTRLFS